MYTTHSPKAVSSWSYRPMVATTGYKDSR